ncbi:MAG: ATP-binding cassette domain-containing protein [Acidobacteriota bacterium]
MLRIENLSKTYANGVQALRGVNLTLPHGLFGLLGPNGAGKSSLMRTLATLQEADTGTAFLGELDVLNDKPAVRRLLGYLPQDFGLYPRIDAETLLSHFARLKGLRERRQRREVVESLLRLTNLWRVRKQKLGTFSGGMRQRFGIAQALLGDPQLIIVDEPTTGLDPEERRRFLNLLARIGEDAVVILSTHLVADVRELCRAMAIIDRGRVLLEGTPSELVARLEGRVWRAEIEEPELDQLGDGVTLLSTHLNAGRTVARVESGVCPDARFVAAEPDLEDVYFSALRGASLRAAA